MNLKLSQVVYKVVNRTVEGRLTSVYMQPTNDSSHRRSLRLDYSPAYVTIPYGESLIFAFISKEHAFNWTKILGGGEIWKAQTSKIIVPIREQFRTNFYEIIDNFSDFWKCYNNNIKVPKSYDNLIPVGTILCPDLILISQE